MALAAAAGLISALDDELSRGSGVDHTGGALLVVISSALLLAASLVLALARGAPAWVRGLLLVLSALDLIGTGVAAFFLHGWILLGAIVVAALGWLVHVAALGGHHAEAVA